MSDIFIDSSVIPSQSLFCISRIVALLTFPPCLLPARLSCISVGTCWLQSREPEPSPTSLQNTAEIESQNCRVIWVGRDLKACPIQTLPWAGCLPRIVSSLTLGIYSFSGQPTGRHHPLNEAFPPDIYPKSPIFSFNTIPPYYITVSLCKKSVFSCF